VSVGARLNRPVQFDWYLTFNQRRAFRNGILADRCDVQFGLPASPEYEVKGLIRTRPFLTVSYAVVTDRSLSIRGLEDLRERKVTVQHGTTAQLMLAAMGFERLVTASTAEDAVVLLRSGRAEAAVLWGPSAGWAIGQPGATRWQVRPLAGASLDAPMAAAVRLGNEALLAQVQKALDELGPDIQRRANAYGFPLDQPLVVQPATVDARFASDTRMNLPAAPGNAPAILKVVDAAASADPSAGRVRFNDSCSHCHGTDGASPMRERDLRRMQSRYDSKWRETARTTILNGRSDLGMPVWKDALDESVMANILAFLVTIQR
jgi:polar amino acid transport system substrate-binding protein